MSTSSDQGKPMLLAVRIPAELRPQPVPRTAEAPRTRVAYSSSLHATTTPFCHRATWLGRPGSDYGSSKLGYKTLGRSLAVSEPHGVPDCRQWAVESGVGMAAGLCRASRLTLIALDFPAGPGPGSETHQVGRKGTWEAYYSTPSRFNH